MATYNLPKNWNAFNTCFTHFHKAFTANAKKYGYKASDIKFVNQWYQNWQASYKSYGTWNKPFQNTAFSTYQAFMQNMVTMISAHKNFDGNWTTWFGGATATTTKKTATKKTTTKKAVKPIKSTAKKAVAAKTFRTSPRAKTTGIKKSVTVKPAAKTVTTKKTTAKKPIVKKTASVKKTTTVKAIKPTVKKPTTARKSTIVKKTVAKKAVASTKKATPVKKTVAKSTTTKPIKSVKSVKSSKPAAKSTTKRVSARTTTKATTIKSTATKTSAPFVWFTGSKSGVNVYVGSNKNGTFSLPSGTKAAYVEVKNGGNRWKKLTQGANFPFVHNYSGNGKIQYRACWINSNGKKGSFCKPIAYANSPKAAA